MSLPVPNLDDRRFQDLVDEAKRAIPQFAPAWTNHNVADPGVALIELFAWMSEQVLYRLNQVPDRLYVDFLNLLGMRPFPAAAARTELTFTLAGAPEGEVVIPRGAQVTTDDGTGVVFSTLDELRIATPRLVAAVTERATGATTDVTEALRYDGDVVRCFASDPIRPDDALYLGTDAPLARQLLDLQVEARASSPGVDPTAPPIVWEVWSGEHWLTARVVSDDTGGLNKTGTIRLQIPAAHEPSVLGGRRHHWLRVRLLEVPRGSATYGTSPVLAAVTLTALGGAVDAEHSTPNGPETLGTSDGSPGQRFPLDNRPVLPRSEDERVVLRVGTERLDCIEVDDFGRSGPDDLHVRIDASAGIVEFGPRIRYPDGRLVQHGVVPPYGATVAITGYRHGGGAVGNVRAGMLRRLRTSIPFVARVTNTEPARGGVEPETVEEVKQRAPMTLRTGQRAVTPFDFEQLTREASPQVARAMCLPPATPLDPVRVLVVPASSRRADGLGLDDLALTAELHSTIAHHLERRRLIGTLVEVTAPYYQGVSAVVQLRAAEGRSRTAVKERAELAVARFLSPLEGGLRGDGWPLDTTLTAAQVTALLQEVVGVASVDQVLLFEYDLRTDERFGAPTDRVVLEEGALFLAKSTRVVVR